MTNFAWKLSRYIIIIVLTPLNLLGLLLALVMCMVFNDKETFKENISSFIDAYRW